jgi:Lipocalin-like domain
MASSGLASERKLKKPSPSISDQLVGTWRLVFRAVKHPDGTAKPDPASGLRYPIGYIMYDRTGHTAVQFMRLNRPDNHSSFTYDAYFGTYVVNDYSYPITVTHQFEGSLNPNAVGRNSVRDVIINGDESSAMTAGGSVLQLLRSSGAAAGVSLRYRDRSTSDRPR